MDHDRQSRRVCRFSREFERFQFILPIGGKVGAEPQLDAKNDVAIGFDAAQSSRHVQVPQVVEFANRRVEFVKRGG